MDWDVIIAFKLNLYRKKNLIGRANLSVSNAIELNQKLKV